MVVKKKTNEEKQTKPSIGAGPWQQQSTRLQMMAMEATRLRSQSTF
jgi:hypothetical protein